MRLARLFLLAAGAAALAASGASAADFVTLTGTVKMKEAPKPEAIEVKTDKETCCKDGDLLSTKLLVNPKTLGVQNVVVYLRPDSDDKDAAFPPDKIAAALQKAKPAQHVIDQPKCQFEPRIVAARDGDTLVIKNSAGIAHNSHLLGPDPFVEVNPTVPAGKEFVLDAPLKANRRPITIKCDIHGWMEGRIRVFDHPYFAVTDKDGKFEIKDAPAGKWRLVYWHEGGFHNGKDGMLGEVIEIKGDKTMELPAIDLNLPK